MNIHEMIKRNIEDNLNDNNHVSFSMDIRADIYSLLEGRAAQCKVNLAEYIHHLFKVVCKEQPSEIKTYNRVSAIQYTPARHLPRKEVRKRNKEALLYMLTQPTWEEMFTRYSQNAYYIVSALCLEIDKWCVIQEGLPRPPMHHTAHRFDFLKKYGRHYVDHIYQGFND